MTKNHLQEQHRYAACMESKADTSRAMVVLVVDIDYDDDDLVVVASTVVVVRARPDLDATEPAGNM